MAKGDVEDTEELFPKYKKLLVLEDNERLSLAGAPVNEGLETRLVSPLLEEVCMLVWDRDMPGQVAPTQVEKALRLVFMDSEAVVVVL